MALQNKLGIRDSAELARVEEKISKEKAVGLYANDIASPTEVGKFSGLAKIHKFLFDEIYDFAGTVRTVNIVKDVEIKVLLKNALTDKIDDREVYRKGIDASYYYEGYNTFKMEELK